MIQDSTILKKNHIMYLFITWSNLINCCVRFAHPVEHFALHLDVRCECNVFRKQSCSSSDSNCLRFAATYKLCAIFGSNRLPVLGDHEFVLLSAIDRRAVPLGPLWPYFTEIVPFAVAVLVVLLVEHHLQIWAVARDQFVDSSVLSPDFLR